MAILISNGQLNQVANVLSEAFFNDSMFTYILPDEQERSERLQWFFKSGIRYGMSNGSVYTNRTEDGGAIWLSPGKTAFTFLRMLRAGMLEAPVRLGLKAFARFQTLTSATEVTHKRLMSSPHYYLLTLGVKPSKQRTGVGSDLLYPVLAQADRDRVPCYLETEQEHNLHFYQKHGFYVAHEGMISPDGPRFWAMVRDPR